MRPNDDGPLAGVTVLDLTAALSGPLATLVLAGLGATVIKIENPAGGEGARNNVPYLGKDGASLRRRDDEDMSLALISRNRRKQGITLNLKDERGVALFLDLAEHADVVVQNYGRGVADRLGIGYEAVRKRNEAIVYCSISGFGSDDQLGSAKAMDIIIQALSGVMMTSGEEGDPPVRLGLPVGDLSSSMFAVVGILAALREAERSGVGQHVDVSMLGVLTSLVATEPWETLEREGIPTRTGRTVRRLAPFGIFETLDGYVAICGARDKFTDGLFEALGRPELAQDPRFRTRDLRVQNADDLHEAIEKWTSQHEAQFVVSELDKRGVPAAVVRGPAEAMRDPRVQARGETVHLTNPYDGSRSDIVSTGLPISFSRSPAHYEGPAPRLGEHTESVLEDLLGYSAADIAALARAGVI